MAVDPDFLAIPPAPMSWPPDVIGSADVVARAANVVRPIANLYRYRCRIASIIGATTVIRSATIIRSVTWVGAIVPFTPYCTERCENQNEQESRPSQFDFCLTLCARCFFVRRISNVRFHTLIIRITSGTYAPVFTGTASARGKNGVEGEAITRPPGRAWRRRL
jgi:hypothetical protein